MNSIVSYGKILMWAIPICFTLVFSSGGAWWQLNNLNVRLDNRERSNQVDHDDVISMKMQITSIDRNVRTIYKLIRSLPGGNGGVIIDND